MPIVVEATTEDAYQAWVAEKKSAMAAETVAAGREWQRDELMARGEEVYLASCAACHQVDGRGVPNAFPAIRGSKVATGDLKHHLQVVLNGRPDTAMRSFAGELSDVELAAVVTYQRNAFGNDAGDLVQPSMIAASRSMGSGGI